jgi:hypothetical protein
MEDTTLCDKIDGIGIIGKAAGACCYVATVNNVNLENNSMTVTFDVPPEGLEGEVVLAANSIRYNCGLCYTGGLGSNLPAMGFEREDRVLCLISPIPPPGYSGAYRPENVAVVGHEFPAGVEDQKACGQMGFLPLWPADAPGQGYGEPFLVEVTEDGVTRCDLVAPYVYSLIVTVAKGTLGGANSGAMVYASGDDLAILRPYLLPNGGSFEGYRLLNNTLIDSYFAYGVRLATRQSHFEAGGWLYASANYLFQQPRHIGLAGSLAQLIINSGNFLTYTGSTGTSLHYIARYSLFQSELFLISDADEVLVQKPSTNTLRRYQLTIDPELLTVTSDGSYVEQDINSSASNSCHAARTLYETPVIRSGINQFVNKYVDTVVSSASSGGMFKLFHNLTSGLEGSASKTRTVSKTWHQMYLDNSYRFAVNGTYSDSGSATYLLNGNELATIDYDSEIVWDKTGGPSPPEMENPACGGARETWDDSVAVPYAWSGSASGTKDRLIFLALSPSNDFAIFIKTSVSYSALLSGTAGPADVFLYDSTYPPTLTPSTSTVTTTLCIYSGGTVTEIETYTTTYSGVPIESDENETYGATLDYGAGTLSSECILDGLYYFRKWNFSNTETYGPNQWYNVTPEHGISLDIYHYAPVFGDMYNHTYQVSDPFRGGVWCHENPFGEPPIFTEFSISDDGALAWIVMRRLDNTGKHRLLVRNGQVETDAESVLDELTNMTWEDGVFSYAKL